MQISSKLKLEPSLEILQVCLEGILHNDLLRLDVLDVPYTAGQFDGTDSGSAGQARDPRE